jgi:glycosyltransferase involved in cell wall biosynthesis
MNPHIRYYMIGKAVSAEARRMQQLIETLQLQQHVFLLGFVPDALLQQHYLMADVFFMPSQKEGFGIVFIEAMACGLPVIAGNKDGRRDALLNVRLGTLVDPTDPAAILQALQQTILQPPFMKGVLLQQEEWKHFSFKAYKMRLQQLLAGDKILPLEE